MARTPITPVKAQANAKQHLHDCEAAVVNIRLALAGHSLPDGDATTEVLEAAKVLEAAGCYIRRQHAKGLLIP